jgi:hypothetical protein
MTQTEALRLALEALEKTQAALAQCFGSHKSEEGDRHRALAYSRTTISAIKAALEAKDEPVGTAGELFSNTALERLDLRPSTGIYITPPQRKPLTDEEIWNNDAIMAANSGYGAKFETLRELVQAIEAAHGIKGEA